MDLPKLNFNDVTLKVKVVNGIMQVFDQVRKKYIKITPEEWVRQHIICFLHKTKNYPLGLISVEKMVKYNNLQTRADIVLYDRNGSPNIIVECKAPNIKISQSTFNQIARYNFKLRVNFLIVTNGMTHYCCKMNYDDNSVDFLDDFPFFA
mgnify:FL=1|tara:strand:+ start:110 stop:559 length:450 start_codon:yes stop_codon:yes gene_type:complete